MLFVLAMFFAATLADLNLPASRESRFSLAGTIALFPFCILLFLGADYALQALKPRPLSFRAFYVGSGVVLQLLGDADAAVADVALAVGYDTSQALARAFRDRFDASPAELRADPDRRAATATRPKSSLVAP